MSVESLSWALNLEHPDLTAADKLVLVGICNHDGDGGAWPSMATLARYATVSVRSVRRIVAKLEELGFVTRHVNAGGTDRTPLDRRPNLFEVHRAVMGVRPREDVGVRPGGTWVSGRGGTPASAEPSSEPSIESDASRRAPSLLDLDSDAVRLCHLLAGSIEARGSKRPAVTDTWVRDMDRMLRLDDRDPVKVERMIRFLEAGATDTARFWQSNVRSPATLRARYDQIRERAAAEAAGRGGPVARRPVDDDRTAASGVVDV